MVDEVVEGELKFQDFGGDSAGDAAGVFVAQGLEASGGIVSIVRTDTCSGSVFKVGAPSKPGFGGCWVRPGQDMAELEAMFGLPEGGHPGIWFRGRRARPGVWR